tara:strand:+ start:644 stop:949 length:306 start_codon:yes stop_codon:yes gene_type:complete
MSDLTNKDAEQDTKIAVIDSTLDNTVRRIEMVHQRVDRTNEDMEKLTDRIRVLERWVAGAGAVIAAATFIIGIAVSADSKEIDHGHNGTTKSEVVLQLQGS